MLNSSKKRESLVGKLLLSSALVAVSLAYGWWQRPGTDGPTIAMAPMPVPRMPDKAVPVPDNSVAAPTPPEAPTQSATQDNDAASGAKDSVSQTAAPPLQNSVAVAKAVSQAALPASPVAPQSQQIVEPPSAPPTLTPQQALQMYVPMDGASPPFPLVTGSPEPGTPAPVPAGLHLADGDHVSAKHGLMWGDLRVRISVSGGVITGVQVLQYPDHRSQSLYLSQLAIPVLESEVIKSQKAQVDVVSSATDTSYTFQDAVADAITKATRG